MFLKGVYKGSIVGFYSIEAFIIRMGFFSTITTIRDPPNPILITKAPTLAARLLV